MVEYTGMKVFSATKAKEREDLGDKVTRWMRANPEIAVKETVIRQSSDNEFHCLSIIVFYASK